MESTRAKVEADKALRQIADYLFDVEITSAEAFRTARYCLADTLGCGLLALNYPECSKLLGPIIEGTVVPNGCKVPGTSFVLDPIRAAFNIGTMIRWLDYNDTWLAAEWGHPSDNLGGIFAVADYLSRRGKSVTVRNVLKAMIQAHEIQGVLALENSFNRIGFDHVILVKIATVAVVTKMLGGTRDMVIDALSNGWIDTGPLRTYRHAPNTGSRKSWAAGDATSRGVQLAMMTLQGEMGYRAALTAPKWGFYDVLRQGKPFVIDRPLGSYVMENVLFKVAYPAEFHAQTAVEAAITLHGLLGGRFKEIRHIRIRTHESAVRIIDKKGPLKNPADRDHCLQYMVAVGLLFGELTADYYEEKAASDVRIDQLREKMVVEEEKQYSKDYLDPSKRSIANRIEVELMDGTVLGPIEVEYPIGHKRRREEGIPLLVEKFHRNLSSQYGVRKAEEIAELFENQERLEDMPFHLLSDLLEKE